MEKFNSVDVETQNLIKSCVKDAVKFTNINESVAVNAQDIYYKALSEMCNRLKFTNPSQLSLEVRNAMYDFVTHKVRLTVLD
jgi:hypothetical protein